MREENDKSKLVEIKSVLTPNNKIVDTVREILLYAESGKLRSLAICGQYFDGGTASAFTVSKGCNGHELIGLMYELLDQCLQDVKNIEGKNRDYT